MKRFTATTPHGPLTVTLYATGDLSAWRTHQPLMGNQGALERLRVSDISRDGVTQHVVTDGEREWLVSFWGGTDEPPEIAPRVSSSRWGAPLPLVDVAPVGGA